MKKLLIIPMLFMYSMVIGQSKKIIGNPIKIENLEVAQHDFPNRMTGDDAKAACAKLGEGWRLPTKDELAVMYRYKDKIGGFANVYYWRSTEASNNGTWMQDFDNGLQKRAGRISIANVRAVRAF